jgi:hypothetical protein
VAAGRYGRLVSAVAGEQRQPESWTGSDRRQDRIRYGLAIGWLIVIIAIPLTGERISSWGEVRSLVAAGKVDSVRVTGELPRGTGFSVVDVHWRHGWLHYTAQVVHVRGQGRSHGAEAATDGDAPVVRTAPTSTLTALQPGLQVTRDEGRADGGRLIGFQVPNALTIPAFLLFVTALGLLISGPQPWRATRWAWFWLMTPPAGSLVYLLLSGPTPGVPVPRDPHRRLTGGWALLLSVLLMSVIGS